MSESIEAVIDDVIIQPSKIQPIIVNFQNGALKDEETSRMKCGVYHDTKEDKTVLAMSNGQVVYKGYRPDHDKELTYTMLAIHSKRTGKIRLVQAERWQVAPILDKHVNVEEDLSALDKTNALNKQFGSKKVKRRTEQYERMRINIDSVKEQLEKTVSNVEIDRADLTMNSLNSDNANDDNLPSCNRNASIPDKVYNLYEIVPKEMLKSLYEKIDEILEFNSDRSQFYAKTFEKLESDSKRTKKLAMLEYIETVRNWFNLPIKFVNRRDFEICPFSEQIQNHVINSYSMSGVNGRQRPSSMRDKGITHCMIIALMIWNYKLDLDLFMTLFKSQRGGAKKFSDVARIIGAMPTKENKKIVVLSIPLPPPLKMYKNRAKKI